MDEIRLKRGRYRAPDRARIGADPKRMGRRSRIDANFCQGLPIAVLSLFNSLAAL
jgi:hypothetical protein